MCPPPTGHHKLSPPEGNNEFLGMEICISLPTHGNTTTKHPMPQQCARHMSIHSDLTPMEKGSYPRAKESQRTLLIELGLRLITQQLLQRPLGAV